MKNKTAQTSINCYKNHVKGWRETSENKIIYEAIKRIQPCTGRMLAKETGIENSDVSRSLNNLWYKLKPAPIQISHKAYCPITGVKVKFYCIDGAQTNLFD